MNLIIKNCGKIRTKRSEGDSIPVQKVEDKKILILMSSEMYMGNPYTVVFYNDITEIYERTDQTFCKGTDDDPCSFIFWQEASCTEVFLIRYVLSFS